MWQLVQYSVKIDIAVFTTDLQVFQAAIAIKTMCSDSHPQFIHLISIIIESQSNCTL